MRVSGLAALAAAFMLSLTGCQMCGMGNGCGPTGCDSPSGGCTSGRCGGLVGLLPGFHGNACNDCGPGGCVTPETLAHDGYGTRGGHTGPLAGLFGQHHAGPQSHMGAYPGPADGPPTPTVAYPYYTTRGPRDFFLDDPASIGP
jgi:hypothetical protein